MDNFFLYIQKDYSGDFQLQCYGMDTDNSWTSGGESDYCAIYSALYEGAKGAIRWVLSTPFEFFFCLLYVLYWNECSN